jgi:hypothetical protein
LVAVTDNKQQQPFSNNMIGPTVSLVVSIAIIGTSFWMSPVASQTFSNKRYCGTEPCIIPLRLSCEQMIEEYKFQGSCCSMESIPETRGCRVTVADRGNCYWYPYCGMPDPLDEEISAGFEHTTDSDQECPESEFDPLFLNTSSPDYISPENRTNVTCDPTMAPSSPDGTDGSSDSPAGSSGNTIRYESTMQLILLAVVGIVNMIA